MADWRSRCQERRKSNVIKLYRSLKMKQTGPLLIKIGDEVRIQGLRTYQHLNGTTGIAIEWKNDCWIVFAGSAVLESLFLNLRFDWIRS